MADVPKKSIQLFFRAHIVAKNNRPQRIVNPATGYQYEILAEDVDFICPICRYEQAAPVEENTEYACPKCTWRYLVVGMSLWMWHPSVVGVETVALAPGTRRSTLLDGAQDSSEEEAKEEQKRATARWRQAELNKQGDLFGKKIQILTPGIPEGGDDSQ